MNKDFKYSLKGFMVAVLFIAAIKFISFAYGLYFPAKSVTAQSISKLSTPYFPVINERGKKLFSDNCASCHSVTKNIDGPTLENIEERVTSCEVLYAFIRNSEEVIQTGDPYFVALYNNFSKTAMNKFPNLTDKDIDDILEYINQSYENRRHEIYSDTK